MADERRYGEDEVAKIFEAAARRPDPRSLTAGEGMTLAELQAIGGEVGLAPERIAEAAAGLALSRDAARRTDLGLPIGVSRSVDLPRAPNDREWEMIVADLRETFGARGRVGSREWANGNLFAYVEPTATGHRLRMGTVKGSAWGLTRIGALGVLAAVPALMILPPGTVLLPALFAVLGSSAIGWNAFSLPRWAGQRETQMEGIATRTLALLG